MSIETLMTFLENHQTLMYMVLFLGSYLETLIGTSFLIYGEFFFLAGAILAGLGKANLWLVMLVLYSGGLLGDHSSYWIGRRWGDRVYVYLQKKFFFRRFFTVSNYTKGTKFFNTYGGWSVFIGRFLGPVSWITPFLAGVFKFPYKRFTLFDFPAVILGIGQFIVVGYLFGKSYKVMLAIAQQYVLIGLFAGVCLLAIGYYYQHLLKELDLNIRHSLLHYVQHIRAGNRVVIKMSLRTLAIAAGGVLILYIATLLTIFFAGNQRLNGAIAPDLQPTFNSIDEIVQSIDSTTYYKNGTKNIGPINVVLITEESLDTVLTKSGWIKNQTFTRDNVGLFNFLAQAEDNIFPISDLYFKGVPQNYAYQLNSSTLSQREHLRVWNYGTYNNITVYVISVSNDIGFDFYRNLSFLVPLHAIDPNIDASRSLLVTSIRRSYPSLQSTLRSSPEGAVKLKEEEEREESGQLYHTDGLISILEF